MSKKLFHHIDENVFKGIDNIKGSPQFSQLSNSIEGLPEEVQKLVNQGLSYLLSFLPLIILFIFFLVNLSFRNDNAKKIEFINNVQEFNNLNSKISQVSRNLLGPKAYADQLALESTINSIQSGLNLSRDDLRVGKFESKNVGDMSEADVQLTFRNLSTPKLAALLERFAVGEKAIIKGIFLQKEGSKLEGSFSFLHYGRVAQVPAEEGPQ